MPEKEKLAISKIAYIIFPWQVERILQIKFPGEVSRAEEAGFVSCVKCHCSASGTAYVRVRSLFACILIQFSTNIPAGLLGQATRNSYS